MQKIVFAIVISAAAAFAAASFIYMAGTAPEAPASTTEAASTFEPRLPVEERIAALERAISDERFARQL